MLCWCFNYGDLADLLDEGLLLCVNHIISSACQRCAGDYVLYTYRAIVTDNDVQVVRQAVILSEMIVKTKEFADQ